MWIQTRGGAQITDTNNTFHCSATPCQIELPRRTDITLVANHEGCREARIRVQGKGSVGGNWSMWGGNLIAGGVIGMAVDGTSGARLDLQPNPAIMHLDCS